MRRGEEGKKGKRRGRPGDWEGKNEHIFFFSSSYVFFSFVEKQKRERERDTRKKR